MNNGPDLWDAVLAHVRTEFPEAIIAGGCVRDYLHGKPAKDIDIFVDFGSRGLEDFSDKAATLDGPDFKILRQFDPGYVKEMGSDDTVRLVSTFASSLGHSPERITSEWEVQLIGLNLPEFTIPAALDRIDFGLCRVAYTGRSERTSVLGLAYGLGYWGDHQGKKMTVYRADNETQLKASYKRYERLVQKYPDHKLYVHASGT